MTEASAVPCEVVLEVNNINDNNSDLASECTYEMSEVPDGNSENDSDHKESGKAWNHSIRSDLFSTDGPQPLLKDCNPHTCWRCAPDAESESVPSVPQESLEVCHAVSTPNQSTELAQVTSSKLGQWIRCFKCNSSPSSESKIEEGKLADSGAKGTSSSESEGWILASRELRIRNPFCIANHPAKEQVAFYQKVLLISAVFKFMVALATLLWTWWWSIMMKEGTKPIIPCNAFGTTFGEVRLCNETSSFKSTAHAFADSRCDERSPLSICVEDTCVNDPLSDELRSCWYLASFAMVVIASYMLLLFRRDQAGRGLLSCACFIEGILAGAATLHYNSFVFLEFNTYLACICVLALLGFSNRAKKAMPEWEKLPNQLSNSQKPLQPKDLFKVEMVVFGQMKRCFTFALAVVSVAALPLHFGILTHLESRSIFSFIATMCVLWIAIGWVVREMSWTMHKYDADQYVNMCISLHVDLYCIFLLFPFFVLVAMREAFLVSMKKASCREGVIGCLPKFGRILAVQAERFVRFACGIPGKNMCPLCALQAAKKNQSQKVHREVETVEAKRLRKIVNLICVIGIFALAGVSFFSPQLSFGVALVLCMFLPFVRVARKIEHDHGDALPASLRQSMTFYS